MRSSQRLGLASLLALALCLTATAAPVPLPKVGTGDADAWLLDDADVVFVVNVKQMMGSDLIKKNGGAAAIKDALKSNEQVSKIIEATGIDLTKDVDGVVASAVTTSKEPRSLIVVKGNFDTDKLTAAMKKKADKTHTEGKATVFELKMQDKGEPLFAVVKDKGTLVVAQSKALVADRAENGGQKSAKVSKAMATATKKFTGKESMAMVVLVTEEMKKQIAKAPPQVSGTLGKLSALRASLTMTDGVGLNITGVTNDAQAAKDVAKQLQFLKALGAVALANAEDLPAGLNDVLNAIEIKSDKESAQIRLDLTKEKIEKLGKTDN